MFDTLSHFSHLLAVHLMIICSRRMCGQTPAVIRLQPSVGSARRILFGSTVDALVKQFCIDSYSIAISSMPPWDDQASINKINRIMRTSGCDLYFQANSTFSRVVAAIV